MIEEFLHWIVAFVEAIGYPGIFVMAALESTFVPIPSEATLIPAGFLVHQGKMDGLLVFILAITGTMTGSLANYFIAKSCGRFILIKYGRFFFINEEKMEKVEGYFNRHGPISIFLARLVFGVRHFISFPAGLANMNLVKFSLYTALGGGLWTLLLLILGYELGDNQALVKSLMPELKIGCIVAVALIAAAYAWRYKKKLARQTPV
jgi:membrane protein DedA with SNARE-associated domain